MGRGGGLGGLGGLGRLGRVGVYTSVRVRLSFAYRSLIVRLSFALPVSFLYRLYRVSEKRKKNLLIGKFANL